MITKDKNKFSKVNEISQTYCKLRGVLPRLYHPFFSRENFVMLEGGITVTSTTIFVPVGKAGRNSKSR